MDNLWDLLGRFHPLAVHLPIGIFILLALIELAACFPRGPKIGDVQRTFMVTLGVVVAAATALFGWLLAREGGYDATLLGRHQWLGFAFAGLAGMLLVAQLRRWRRTYGLVLVASVVVLSVAGHFGGTLTHGENYLAASAITDARRASIDPASAQVFTDVIHPILQQRCIACHGATKSNGDLRYDTLEQLLKGGKNGPAFKPGDVTASRMIQRVHLPLEAKEHMPPKGKPQLTDDEVALLEWWIEAGAPTDRRVADVTVPAVIAELIAAQLGVPPTPSPNREEMLASAAAIERQLGVVIHPLAADGPWLAVNARLQFQKFGDAELAALAPIAAAIHRLDLGETAVTDAGLGSLAPMKNLRRLHLDRTAVTDAGLTRLPTLLQLESLNLHATKVTNAGLDALRKLPRLRALYLWQTQVTPEAVAKFSEDQTDRRKIARWKSEIAALEANIRAEHFNANLGESLRTAPPPVAKPAEAKPVAAPGTSAKKLAPSGPTVPSTTKTAATPDASKPINTRCPVSGEIVDPNVNTVHQNRFIAFCCEGCLSDFLADPTRFTVTSSQ